jgi:DNA-binding NarL/FixJ family response regulator
VPGACFALAGKKSMTRQVLFVGGSPEAFLALSTILRGEPYEVERVETASDAWLRLDRASVVVAAEDLPGGGATFLGAVRAAHPLVVRLLVLGEGGRQQLLEAVNRAEVYRILPQPLDATTLGATLREALTEARLREAQDAIWSAARQQQAALGRLRTGDLAGEIVEALGSGRRVKDIARDLIISTHTVRNHLKAIYRKLNVRSQFELIGMVARSH